MTNEMVLEKKSSLVMPTYYVELDRDEMCYVEGGATQTYTGNDAILQITMMVGAGIQFLSTAITLFKATIASAATVAGAALAVITALAGIACLGCGLLNLGMAIAATTYYFQDGGFKLKTKGFLFWSINFVERL